MAFVPQQQILPLEAERFKLWRKVAVGGSRQHPHSGDEIRGAGNHQERLSGPPVDRKQCGVVLPGSEDMAQRRVMMRGMPWN